MMQPFVAPRPTDDEAPALEIPAGATDLGEASGLRWIRADSPGEPWRTPTHAELDAAIRELPPARTLKSATRRQIEREVGDELDLIADMARQIESLTALSCRMALELWGEQPAAEPIKSAYAARAQAVVSAMEAGDLKLRGDYEEPEAMLQRLLDRTDRINRIIGEQYLPRRAALLGDD